MRSAAIGAERSALFGISRPVPARTYAVVGFSLAALVLTELPGGRTRLEGSTWYTLDIAPADYWRIWAEGLVHTIHMRVLEHIKPRAEGSASVTTT